MSRTGLALVIASAMWISGCSVAPTTEQEGTATASSKQIKNTIEQEIQALLAGESESLSHQPADWSGLESHSIRRGDTMFSILENAGAPRSLITDLRPADKKWLSHLEVGGELLLLRQEAGVIGFAVKGDVGWRMATQGDTALVDRSDVSLDRPHYEVIDLKLADSLEETLANSALGKPDRDRFTTLLLRAFPDNALPTGGWLRLRTAQHQHEGKALGDPLLISAAISDNGSDNSRYMVRIESPGSGAAYYNGDGAKLAPSWLSHPVGGDYRITSDFNPHRRHPITRRVRPHNGRDFAAATGTPVLAASDGKVVRAGMRGSWGRLIVLSHSDGIETRYAHLSRIEGLSVGDRVTQGQVIGRVGTTGMSTGPHLHFEVHANGRPHDPATFDPATFIAGAGEQLAGQDMQDMQAYLELEDKALAMLPSQTPTLIAGFGGQPGLTGLGGPEPEDELPSQEDNK